MSFRKFVVKKEISEITAANVHRNWLNKVVRHHINYE